MVPFFFSNCVCLIRVILFYNGFVPSLIDCHFTSRRVCSLCFIYIILRIQRLDPQNAPFSVVEFTWNKIECRHQVLIWWLGFPTSRENSYFLANHIAGYAAMDTSQFYPELLLLLASWLDLIFLFLSSLPLLHLPRSASYRLLVCECECCGGHHTLSFWHLTHLSRQLSACPFPKCRSSFS